jgi:hypothetical protein
MTSRKTLPFWVLVTAMSLVACGHEVQSPPVSLKSAVPDLVCTDQLTTEITITGDGMRPMPTKTLTPPSELVLPAISLGRTVDLSGAQSTGTVAIPDDPTKADQSYVKWDSEQQMRFRIDPALKVTPGLYDLTVQNPDKVHSATLPGAMLAVPPPTAAGVAPDLLCDAQTDVTVTVTGSGFLKVGSALPVFHFGETEVPASSADGCKDLPGKLAEGTVQSCTSVTAKVTQGLLKPGPYSLTITNPPPANCSTTEPIQVVVVPPPSIAMLSAASICDAQSDQMLTITGSGFLKVGDALPTVRIGDKDFKPTSADGCTPVMGMFTEGKVETCTSLVITIPKGTFKAGTYQVTVSNPKPADCASTENVMLKVNDPPVVTNVKPASVCAGGSQIEIDGTGFIATPMVTLVDQMGGGKLGSSGTMVNAEGTQIMTTTMGGGVVGDTYDVVVTNPDGCSDTVPHKAVAVVPGPVVFYADPEVVYNGVNTRVTIYATTLTLPLPADAVTITPTGQAAPVTVLPWTAVPNHPNRVQVVVPKGQMPGVYDLHMLDATGCSASLPMAITVTADLTITLEDVQPSFGYTKSETAVTIFRDKAAPAPANKPFVATPRGFLNPKNAMPNDIAIPLESTAFVDDATLTSVVPKGQPVGVYDLIVVNPDGAVGLLSDAFTVVSTEPPTVATVTPSSIVDATGQVVTIAGRSFNGSKVSLTCKDGMGNMLPAPMVMSGMVNCDASGNCTQGATIDASALPAGSICVLTLTNADGSFFEYSAIGVTNASLNLSAPKKGPDLNVGRRALVAAAGNATTAARFLYAIAGDGGAGMANAPFDSVEVAPVDLFGNIGAWRVQSSKLKQPRSFAGAATVGRYVYVSGGSDGATSLASAERLMILDPRESPQLDVDDIVPGMNGLDAGYWFYRVSATFTAADPDNPGGEGLASDEIILKVPAFANKKIQVVLTWSKPADSLGAALANVAGYRIYRTPMVNGKSGGEVLIATTDAQTTKYTDDGTAMPGMESPLPLGSTGNPAQLPAMATGRKGAASLAAFDPGDKNKFYVYSLFGLNAAGMAVGSYDYLPVTIQPNGHQVVDPAWKPGAQSSATGRWQLGAWLADSTVASVIPSPDTYIFVGGGMLANNTLTGKVEAGKVAAGGDLGAWNDTPKDFSSTSAGYGVCGANNQLFVFGGAGGSPSNGAKSASLVNPPPTLANNSWNNEGLTMTDSRYLMGSAVQSAFIFLVAGETGASPAGKSTELVVW